MSFNRKSYICAGQGSYDIKDYLKDNGFFFDKKLKAWKKEGNSKDLAVYRREYPNVQWSIIYNALTSFYEDDNNKDILKTFLKTYCIVV